MRSGTLNVPGIVGIARAIELATEDMEPEAMRLAALRSQLSQRLTESAGPVELCGPGLAETDEQGEPLRLPGNLNLSFEGLDGEALLMRLEGLAISSGAACSSSEPTPSHVLLALGLTEDQARSSLRFGLGRFNTAQQVAWAVEQVAGAVRELRKLGSLSL